ncbi:MAG: flagellar hook-length control protein FliK [Gammaproteobacteria bacterium]|nr:flagellar hook-length control protein FliK [Gammaproteobacteria bacterium]
MRTDSNTVLSLPASVPPKRAALTKAPSNNGAAFTNDFNKAKEAIGSKKPPNTEVTSASTSSVATSSSADSSPTTNKIPDQSESSVNGKDKDSVSTAGSSDIEVTEAVAQKGGKALQQEGEGLPAEDSSVVILGDEENAASIASSAGLIDLESPAAKSLPQLSLDASSKGNVGIPASSQSMLAGSTDAVEVSSEATDTKKISDSVIPGAAVVGAGVISLDSIKRGGSNNVAKINSSSTLAASLDKSSEDSVDPFSAKVDKGTQDNELSWVLSQMGTSGVKAVTTDSVGSAALDGAKATVAAGVIVGAMDKQSRSEPLSSSSLLASGDASSLGELNSDSTDSLLGEDGVLINEPIELRKKEHEAMLGRMSAQIDGGLGDDNSPGGLNSSMLNNANRPAVAAAALNASVPNAQANNLAMSLPPGHPGWANEMSQKVAWIARDGGHTAHIRLDPPELGSLTVKVSVDSDSNTQISFVAATPQAKDLLEGQMGRLREMLAQQGMDLSRADVDVSQQDTSGAQDRANNRNGGVPKDAIVDNDDVEDELISSNLSYVSASGVDYYA